MWRRCDLHNHATLDEHGATPIDADEFVDLCIAGGLKVVALTDHDHVENVAAMQAAGNARDLVVIAGVEVTTDHGHVIVIAPNANGLDVLRDLLHRLGARPGIETRFDELVGVVTTGVDRGGALFRDAIILIGAHVERPGSMLASDQPLGLEGQLQRARRMDALEVVSDQTRDEWMTSGVKQQDRDHTIVQGSDSHGRARVDRATWLYLPGIDARSFRHALATPEASVRFDSAGAPPRHHILDVSFEGGMFDGRSFGFCERANAIVGSPSTGKSLILDAIRFAFGMECEIPDIRKNAEERRARCMPDGATVRVRVVSDEEVIEVARTVGGATPPSPPFTPIVFSQTELVRRAMEARPAMALLDVHCPNVADWVELLDAQASAISAEFDELLEVASRARAAARLVRNPQDGLAATRHAFNDLAGSEATAQKANDAERVRHWRTQARSAVTEWQSTRGEPETPALPVKPTLESDGIDSDHFMPTARIAELVEAHRTEVRAAAARLAERVDACLDEGEPALVELVAAVSAALADEGFAAGSELIGRLSDLRTRVILLERQDAELRQLEADLDSRLAKLCAAVDEIAGTRERLRQARKDGCSSVNASMRSFFVRLAPDRVTQTLDQTLEDAKVGTGMWSSTLADLRTSLDRPRILARAIRVAQGRPELLATDSSHAAQDAVVDVALARNKRAELARIATLWPGDGLVIAKLGSPPTPFEQLTEGMRALAIKEVSFASSDLPVVTDQPEDAVPTQAVFDNLVPTLRSQRAIRQFIIASHDANIVVAGDVENICVLDAESSVNGSLFEDGIRSAALDLLEGGRRAFELRSRRYGAP